MVLEEENEDKSRKSREDKSSHQKTTVGKTFVERLPDNSLNEFVILLFRLSSLRKKFNPTYLAYLTDISLKCWAMYLASS